MKTANDVGKIPVLIFLSPRERSRLAGEREIRKSHFRDSAAACGILTQGLLQALCRWPFSDRQADQSGGKSGDWAEKIFARNLSGEKTGRKKWTKMSIGHEKEGQNRFGFQPILLAANGL